MTAVLAVVEALVAAASAGLPGVLVVDGPPMDFADEQRRGQVLYVGWGVDEGAVESVREQIGFEDEAETLTLVCAASAWLPSRDVPGARALVVDVVRRFDDVLAADRKLGGVAYDARLGERVMFDWRGDETSGVRASAAFFVVCRVP